MKNIRYTVILTVCAAVLSSCDSWIKEPTPGTITVDDYYSSAQSAEYNVNAAYVPLMWEFNDTYYSEWFIGDVVSDDALKGGQYVQSDMADVYDMENFKTISNNNFLLQYYRAQFQGVQRCNLVLHHVPNMDAALFANSKKDLQSRIIGEAKFLRAMYYFRLVRVFGGVPLVLDIIEEASKWQQPRATADQVYEQIIKDLTEAEAVLWTKNDGRLSATDLGRATKGAAQAMLLKVNLYIKNYEEARKWGDDIIESKVYSLCPKYADNFTLEGENGQESVFEIQYMQDPTSDYGEGNGFTRGTFATILTRSRSEYFATNTVGWGFNKPTMNLYNEYEEGDVRRDVTIFNPTDEQITNPAEEIYLGDRLLSRKYALYSDDNTTCLKLSHATRSPINTKYIRYADVLLMYAEACIYAGAGKYGDAAKVLNEVRDRAGLGDKHFGSYTIKINGEEINPTIEQAVRHERRMELAMEGHRWFDLCRWGIAKTTMDAYIATETDEVKAEYGGFVAGKHELFPIPSQEIDLNPMDQNPGY
ncbi:MAG: RagB/SusD family nutrient uptake outer membrane protein [Paludibacteraceae bacterium]|nr:RagB/SusD family nutrient uptake outer membrane protein [Paludibacteraceae bacterium]